MEFKINDQMKSYYRQAFEKIFADYAYKGSNDVPQKMVDSEEYVLTVSSFMCDLARMEILNLDGKNIKLDIKSQPDALTFEEAVQAAGAALISMDQNRGKKDKEFSKDERIPEEWVWPYARVMAAAMYDNGYIKEKLFNNPDKFIKKMPGLIKSINKDYWNATAGANQSRTGLIGMIQKGTAKSGSKKENPSPADNMMINELNVIVGTAYGRQLAPQIYKIIK